MGLTLERLLALLRFSLVGKYYNESLFVSMTDEEWEDLYKMAEKQGVLAITFKTIHDKHLTPPELLLMRWFGMANLIENNYLAQEKSASDLAVLFANNGIRTFVMKGISFAQFYPNPKSRQCGDADIYLIPSSKNPSIADHQKAFEDGNRLVEGQGVRVDRDYYKNSAFTYGKLNIENHLFCTQIRGSKKAKKLESLLEYLLLEEPSTKIGNSALELPCAMFNALFLIEHAKNHFLREGISFRHVCDWLMFKQNCSSEYDINLFNSYCEQFGLITFEESMNHLAELIILGSTQNLSENDKLLLDDILSDRVSTSSETFSIKGRLVLIFETLKEGWKYSKFADISMIRWLWQSSIGYFFDRNPNIHS